MNEDVKIIDGREWRKGNSEGVTIWVNTDPPNSNFKKDCKLPPLKTLTAAVRFILLSRRSR